MIIDTDKKNRLLYRWNTVFNTDIKVSDTITDGEKLFDTFLDAYQREHKYIYVENACVCLSQNSKLGLYSVDDGRMIYDEIGANTRKKFRKYLNRFDYIITDFTIGKDLMDDCLKHHANKIFLRYELLHSLYTGSQSNYILDSLPFSGGNPAAYLTEDFITAIKSNAIDFSFIKFASYLLNYFENGIWVDDILIKPKISVSNYGRWYWSGKDKLQNDKKMQNKIIKKILSNGDHFVSLDFVSASSSMLYRITGSKILKQMISSRILHADDAMYKDNVKGLLNFFIHGNENPKQSMDYLDYTYDFGYISKVGKFDVKAALIGLYRELEEYNRKVVGRYRQTLTFNECKRRIINAECELDSDKNIIKKHRVYLQGHIYDNLILLIKEIYDATGILPLYTVHDCVNYYIKKTEDYEKFLEAVKNMRKEIKLPYRIEISG